MVKKWKKLDKNKAEKKMYILNINLRFPSPGTYFKYIKCF